MGSVTSAGEKEVSVGWGDGEYVAVGVWVGVSVGVGVEVRVGVKVEVGLGVGLGVCVAVGVKEGLKRAPAGRGAEGAFAIAIGLLDTISHPANVIPMILTATAIAPMPCQKSLA